MPSITDFLSLVRQKGLARTEKFSVQISRSGGNILSSERDISLLCESVAIPKYDIGTKVARINNLNIQRPSTVEFGGGAAGEGAILVFFMDSDWATKRYFDDWMNSIVDRNRLVGEYIKSIGTIDINAIHEGPLTASDTTTYEEHTRYSVKLVEAFPIHMRVTEMAHSAIGIHRLTVTFAYKYWEENNTTD
jgi:hypothetical protein